MKALPSRLVLTMKLEKLTAVTALLLLAGMVACSDDNNSAGSGDGLGASDPVPAGQVKNFTVSTLLGDRTTAEVADQPDSQGKDVATMSFSCGASSGNCGPVIYHAVTAAGQYQFIDTGAYPPITFTVASAGGGSTSGTFQIQFPAELGGENVEIMGDQYPPTTYCESDTVLTATRLDGTGDLWFCVGYSGGDLGDSGPPGPEIVAPATVAGQFIMPGYTPGPCTASGTWKACPGWGKSEEVICFGGSSDLTFPDEVNCLPEGPEYSASKAHADKVWFSIGGGNPDPDMYWSTEKLTALSASMDDGTINSDDFYGIFYDVEVFYNATYQSFADSFALAKQKGLKVMVGTSYTAPYDCTTKNPSCIGFPVGFPAGTDALWKQIIANTDIDILSPQWYGGSGEGEINFVQTSGSSVTFADWNTLVPATTKIISMLKVWNPDIDTNLTTAMTQLQDGCDASPDQARFCETGTVYVWTSN